MANEVAVKFSDQLSDKLLSVEKALPKDFNRERFVQNCLAVANEKPELMKINRAEVVQGLLKGAYLGLDFARKECYLIPYGNSVQFQTDYKGEVKFVKRYAIRPIHDVYAKVVRKGDYFEEKVVDGKPSIDFKPLPFNGEEIVGAFACVLYKDGGMEYETMTTADINSVRNSYSKAPTSKAWKNSWDEMAKKTVLRRLCKHIETDFETVEAQKAWYEGGDMHVSNRQNNPEEVIDVFSKNEVEDIEIVEIEEPEIIAQDIEQMEMPEAFK